MSTNIAHILQEMKKSQTDENNVLNLESAFIVGFGIQLGQVIQRINLPLLRLVHQFSAMYENVVQTRFEMRSNRTTYTQNDLDANNREEGDDFSLNSLSTVTSVSSDDSLSISADLPPVRPPRGRKAEEFVITIESPTDEKVVAFPETTTTTAGQLPTTTSATRAPGSEPKSSIDSFTQVEKCWRTVYFLLDQHRRNRVQMYLNSSSAFSNKNAVAHLLNQPESTEANSNTVYLMYPNLDLFGGCPVIVAGSGLVKRMNLVAMLSTLKLDGDLTNFSFSLTHQGSSRRERPKPAVTFSPVVHLKNILTTSFEVNLGKWCLFIGVGKSDC